jgi:DNA-binding transcriptional MerR regulator
MEYTVSQLAELSGVSARTLRYYDEIDLLKPARTKTNGYRIYGSTEVNLLQQILFYRELEMSLETIEQIVHAQTFDVEQALQQHLIHLQQKRNRLDDLIDTVEKSIQEAKGEIKMSDQEKFEAFKKDLVEQNEAQYGSEIREQYGEEVVEQSNEKIYGMTKAEYEAFEAATAELNEKLAQATALDEPASNFGQEVAALHQDWLKRVWPKGHYTEEAHYNLSLMYVEDERFKAYYEEIAPGAAEYLHAALKKYLNVDTE